MGLFSGSVSSTYEFPSLGQSHSFWEQCLPSLCGQCRMWWWLPWQDVITIKWYKIFQLPSVCLSTPRAIIPQGGKYRIGIQGWEWDSGVFSHFVWLVIVYTFSFLLIGPFLGLLVREESFLLLFFWHFLSTPIVVSELSLSTVPSWGYLRHEENPGDSLPYCGSSPIELSWTAFSTCQSSYICFIDTVTESLAVLT